MAQWKLFELWKFAAGLRGGPRWQSWEWMMLPFGALCAQASCSPAGDFMRFRRRPRTWSPRSGTGSY
jgi:hypothetical protein